MRWRLIILISAAAAAVAFCLWCLFAIGVYGSARIMAQSDRRLIASTAIPLLMGAVASVFVYRHTAKRRKLQAAMSAVLAIILAVDFYVAAWVIFPDRFYIPKTYEVRHAR
jgi:hypothetical protein